MFIPISIYDVMLLQWIASKSELLKMIELYFPWLLCAHHGSLNGFLLQKSLFILCVFSILKGQHIIIVNSNFSLSCLNFYWDQSFNQNLWMCNCKKSISGRIQGKELRNFLKYSKYLSYDWDMLYKACTRLFIFELSFKENFRWQVPGFLSSVFSYILDQRLSSTFLLPRKCQPYSVWFTSKGFQKW